MGRTSYIGFFVDWFIESISTAALYATFILSVSIYVGIFLYIDGMVLDMRKRIISLNDVSTIRPRQLEKWSIYLTEIQFHNDIIG